MSINKCILVGRLGNDPEIRYTSAGVSVSNFNIATNERWKNKENEPQTRTEWHRIVVWGKLAQICADYLSKGREVYIEGKLQTRKWDDKDGNQRQTTEIVATNVTFLGNAPKSEGPNEARGESELSLEDRVPF